MSERESDKSGVFMKIALPVLILFLGIVTAAGVIALKPDVERRPSEAQIATVEAQTVTLETRRLTVTSQGTVSPRTESQLVPEVAGRVIWVSRSFASGGFFEKGESLVRVDPFDYEQAVVSARSDLARAKLALAQQEAEARVARKEWEELGAGDGTPLTLREPQLADANAGVEAAAANLERAKRNLARTELTAPYAGRVRQKNVDVGQFLTLGAPIATIYSVDAAEIRLPLPDTELEYVDLPLTYRGRSGAKAQPKVTIRAQFAGKAHAWAGRIVRTEGEIDPVSRMVHAVAEVRNPYAAGDDPERPPLNVGMFVEAEIEGRVLENVVRLPRTALRGDGRVWVIDDDLRLRYRDVVVARRTESFVLIADGLAAGERVCLSPLEATTDGMTVRIAESSSVGSIEDAP